MIKSTRHLISMYFEILKIRKIINKPIYNNFGIIRKNFSIFPSDQFLTKINTLNVSTILQKTKKLFLRHHRKTIKKSHFKRLGLRPLNKKLS